MVEPTSNQSLDDVINGILSKDTSMEVSSVKFSKLKKLNNEVRVAWPFQLVADDLI